jgi:hypothetical protein
MGPDFGSAVEQLARRSAVSKWQPFQSKSVSDSPLRVLRLTLPVWPGACRRRPIGLDNKMAISFWRLAVGWSGFANS